MSDYPLVSIGLAVYNGENFLYQALGSLVTQDYPNMEILISDNASTDKTQSICEGYCARDNRVKYHRNSSNIGAPANFNLVFGLASGEYFMWASHDDYRDPGYISACVDGFKLSDKLVLVGTECNCIDAKGKLMFVDKSLSTVGQDPMQRFIRYKHILHEYKSHRGGIFYGLYKRCALATVMPMKKMMTADQNMMLKLCLLGEFDIIPARMLTRRMSGASGTGFKAMARSYGITNPILINGAYFIREYEIDKTLARSGNLAAPQKLALMVWSLAHTFVVVSSRVVYLGLRRLKR